MMGEITVFQEGSKWGDAFCRFLHEKYNEQKKIQENGGSIDAQEFSVLEELKGCSAFSLTVDYYKKYGFQFN